MGFKWLYPNDVIYSCVSREAGEGYGGTEFAAARAALRDEQPLWDFYQFNQSDTLPVPSFGTIRKALTHGSLLIVEDAGSGAIAATAGYFEYVKSVDGHIVFELAGTRVKTGRFVPIPLQQILLAVRLFQIAVTEDQTRTQISVISSAKHPRSKDNLIALGLTEIQFDATLDGLRHL